MALLLITMSCGGSGGQQQSTESDASSEAVGQSVVVDEVSNPNVVQVTVSSSDHITLVAAHQAT